MLVYLYRHTESREFFPVYASDVIVLIMIIEASGSRTASALRK